jgi:hypothetical protein
MRSKLAFVMIGLVIVGLTSTAVGQTYEGDLNSPAYKAGLDPAWGVAPTQTLPQYSAFVTGDIGVPVMVDVDHDLVRPGANLHLQGGWDLGYFAPFLHAGWRWIPVDFDRAADAGQDYGQSGRSPLKNPYFGFGIRGQVPNSSRFLPYASMSFDFDFWNFREEGVACGGVYYWWCSSYNVYRFTPGFSWRAGTAIELARAIYIDVGLGVSMSFQGDFFDDNQAWVEPYVGVTHRL